MWQLFINVHKDFIKQFSLDNDLLLFWWDLNIKMVVFNMLPTLIIFVGRQQIFSRLLLPFFVYSVNKCWMWDKRDVNLFSQMALDVKIILQKLYFAQKLLDEDFDKREELRSI
jgi:hypothetical protein